eukprot:14544-Eustigmatos_ZCMA.PRE.1
MKDMWYLGMPAERPYRLDINLVYMLCGLESGANNRGTEHEAAKVPGSSNPRSSVYTYARS